MAQPELGGDIVRGDGPSATEGLKKGDVDNALENLEEGIAVLEGHIIKLKLLCLLE